MAAIATPAPAQDLPPLFANLTLEDERTTDKVLSERVKFAFPRNIHSSTLSALLEMDGFDVDVTENGVAAVITEAKFPCMTRYAVLWDETEDGYATNLRADLERRCV